MGPQNSKAQLDKIAEYVHIGLGEGAECLIGGKQPKLEGELANGYFFEPTVLKGHNKMRVFQEEIFGPVLAVTTFKDEAEAIEIANDTLYGLGAGVWTRNGKLAYEMGRAIQAGAGVERTLPRVPGRGVLRWLQDVGCGARAVQGDADPALHPDQEPARQLQRLIAWPVLNQ